MEATLANIYEGQIRYSIERDVVRVRLDHHKFPIEIRKTGTIFINRNLAVHEETRNGRCINLSLKDAAKLGMVSHEDVDLFNAPFRNHTTERFSIYEGKTVPASTIDIRKLDQCIVRHKTHQSIQDEGTRRREKLSGMNTSGYEISRTQLKPIPCQHEWVKVDAEGNRTKFWVFG